MEGAAGVSTAGASGSATHREQHWAPPGAGSCRPGQAALHNSQPKPARIGMHEQWRHQLGPQSAPGAPWRAPPPCCWRSPCAARCAQTQSPQSAGQQGGSSGGVLRRSAKQPDNSRACQRDTSSLQGCRLQPPPTCMPRQMPRYGLSCLRAKLAARILPAHGEGGQPQAQLGHQRGTKAKACLQSKAHKFAAGLL